jgi:O-antigen ligase
MPLLFRLVTGSLLLFLVAMPWLFPLMSPRGGHDGARILQVLLQAGCAVGLWWGAGDLGRLKAALIAALSHPLRVTLLAVAAWVCARAPMPLWAWRELALWTGMALLALWVADIARTDSPWRRALAWALVAGPLAQGLIELALCLAGQSAGVAPEAGLIGLGYDNMRFLNHVQAVAMPLLLLAPAWLPGSRLAPRLAVLAWGLQGALLWASGGRAAMLALTVAAGLVALLAPGRGRSIWRALAQGSLLAGLVYLAAWVALPIALDLATPAHLGQRLTEGAGASSRDVLWREAWQAWQSSPWWGIGPMHLAWQPNRLAMHPHMVYLQVLAEWGLVFTALWLLALAAGLGQRLQAWRQAADAAGAAPTAAWMAVLAALIDGVFSGNFVMPMSQVWIAVAWGLWLGTTPISSPTPRFQLPRLGSVLATALLAGQVLAVAPAWQEWARLDALLRAALAEQIGTRTQPRFWSHGRLVEGLGEGVSGH